MTVRRLEEPCRQCGSPIYQLGTDAPKCSHCGLTLFQWPRVTLTDPHLSDEDATRLAEEYRRAYPGVPATWRGRWRAAGLQLAMTFLACAAILLLAAVGLSLPPRLMLAVGFACIVVGAIAGIWIAAGELVAEWRKRRP